MIVVFGSINVDLVCRVPAIPRPGETVLAPSYATLHGGKGANQAVAAARLGAGLPVLMAGRVGEDGFGQAARENLAREGIDVSAVRARTEPTGCAFIAVDGRGENAIVVASGANGAVTAEDFARPFEPADVLVLQMEVPLAAALAVAFRALTAGARVIWNLAPATADLGRADVRAILAAAHVLVVNEHEAVAAAGLLGHPSDEPETAAAALSGEGTALVLTRGARGALLAEAGSIAAEVPASPVAVVDTTGAGDTFVGALAVSVAEGRALAASLSRACLAASLACRASGAQAGMPTRAELDAAERAAVS